MEQRILSWLQSQNIDKPVAHKLHSSAATTPIMWSVALQGDVYQYSGYAMENQIYWMVQTNRIAGTEAVCLEITSVKTTSVFHLIKFVTEFCIVPMALMKLVAQIVS